MASHADRLKKLLVLQGKLKSLHETRHAGFLVAADRAKADAQDLIAHFDKEGSLASQFPDLYNRRIAAAVGLERANRVMAENEAQAVAAAKARATMVERDWREAVRADERQAAEVESIELLGRRAVADAK